MKEEEGYQLALIDDLVVAAQKLRAENESLKIAHARYEYVRRLSPRAFAELWQAHINGNQKYDDMVDWKIAELPEKRDG